MEMETCECHFWPHLRRLSSAHLQHRLRRRSAIRGAPAMRAAAESAHSIPMSNAWRRSRASAACAPEIRATRGRPRQVRTTLPHADRINKDIGTESAARLAHRLGRDALARVNANSVCPRPDSESLHHLARVLHLGRLGEAMADELAPLGEVGRAAEIHGVVLERLPLHEQTIATWALDRALQAHALAALARRNSGIAFCTPASKSFSMPGLTSICAISRTMGLSTICARHAPRRRGIQYTMTSEQ